MTEPAHILIVDDDESVRRMLQVLLVGAGFRVSQAGSGEEALAYLDLVTPDLIITDLMLPGMNGRQVMERIKADQTRPFIPVILLTARGEQELKVEALDAGADDFLVKPVDLNELVARVRAMLRLQRSQRSLRAEQRKTELLLHLTRELGTTLDLDELLTHFLDRMADAVGAIRASIILVSGDQPRLFSSTRNRPTVPLTEILSQGIAGWVLRERRATIIDDTRSDGRWVALTPQQRAVRSVAAAPIIREGRSLGAITLVHHTPGYFTSAHLDLLTSVAAQCAIALENAELFRLTRSQKDLLERRAEELQRINQVSRYLAELMSPEQLLRLVVHLIHHTFGYPLVSILLREHTRLEVRAVAGGRGPEQLVGTALPSDGGAPGWAVAHQQPLLLPDIQRDPRGLAAIDEGVRAELAVPIQTSREVFGALDVASYQPDAFGESDVRLLTTLASQLGVALDNARLFDTEQRRVRQLDRVNALSLAITARLDPAENLRVAADAIARIFDVEQCGIAVHGNGVRGGMQVALRGAAASGGKVRFALPLQAIAAAIRIGAPLVLGSVEADPRLAAALPALREANVSAIALAPLISGGRQVGLIVVDVTGRAERFQQGELTLLETVASLIAQVMENARLYREVEDERSTLGAVLRGAADPILLIDPADRLLLANPAAQARLGVTGAGQPLAALSPLPELLRVLDGGRNGAAQTPAEVVLPDGAVFSVSVAPVRGADDAPIGRVAVLQDITALKELERAEQERLRAMFRRYVSPQVVEEVLAGAVGFGAPEEREVVVLFADMRGYTSLAEGLDPRVLVEQVLNRYFTAMTEVLYRHGGTVDKFLGDGLVGLFGVPIARDDDVARSMMAAVDLQLAFDELRGLWQRELGLTLGMGIGLSYGRAVVGNIGSPQRLDYTVIGDVVNTANRLSALARADQIFVSHRLVEALPREWARPWPLRELGPVALKGKHEPHAVYEIEYRAAQDVGR